MNNERSNGMLFNFSKLSLDAPLKFGNIKVYQIGENILERGAEMYEHRQLCNEITYIVSGKADFYVDDKKQTLSQGDIHVVSAGHRHKFIVDTSSRLRFVFIGFDIEPEANNDLDITLANYYNNVTTELLKDNGIIFTIFSCLMNELHSEHKYSNEILRSYMWLILVLVYRIHDNLSIKNTLYSNQLDLISDVDLVGGTVLNIVKYIDSNIIHIDKIGNIAKNLNYSHSYISRIFKEKMNMTIHEYVDHKKIERSMELIKQKKMKLHEIASLLHFDSYRQFNKTFKRITGVAPSEYKNGFNES